MAQNKKNLKNHQFFENCGVQLFKKIQRKHIIETAQEESGEILKTETSHPKK